MTEPGIDRLQSRRDGADTSGEHSEDGTDRFPFDLADGGDYPCPFPNCEVQLDTVAERRRHLQKQHSMSYEGAIDYLDGKGMEGGRQVETDGGAVKDGADRSPPEEILDATCGGRGIWCEEQKENDRTLFIDKRERDPGFCGQPNRYYQVQPDEVEDFRDLPYSEGSFDLVVFDPPHTIRQNGMADLKGHVTKKYGALHAETWQDDLRRGFLELFRVLRPGGTLIFKFADEAADFEQVLELAPEPPLFGTRTKQSKQIETRWFVFYKSEGGELPGHSTTETERGGGQ